MRKKGYETEKEEEPAQGELMVRLLPGEQLGLNAIGGGLLRTSVEHTSRGPIG